MRKNYLCSICQMMTFISISLSVFITEGLSKKNFFFSFNYYINQLYTYISMDSWIFTLFFSYNPLLSLFVLLLIFYQIWPLIAPSSWLLCPFNTSRGFFYSTFISDSTRCFSLSCIFPASILESVIFLVISGSFYWTMVF